VTDARLPGHFLNMPRFDELSDAAVRVLVCSLMWSAEQGTDGAIPARYLRLLHPDGKRPEAFAELVRAGFWQESDFGYEMPGWSTWLRQSTAEQVERYRAGNRMRQQAKRDRAHNAAIKAANTRHVTRDVSRDVGEGEGEGTGKGESKEQEVPGVQWNVAPIPNSATPPTAVPLPSDEPF
jgi:hypothetical protein